MFYVFKVQSTLIEVVSSRWAHPFLGIFQWKTAHNDFRGQNIHKAKMLIAVHSISVVVKGLTSYFVKCAHLGKLKGEKIVSFITHRALLSGCRVQKTSGEFENLYLQFCHECQRQNSLLSIIKLRVVAFLDTAVNKEKLHQSKVSVGVQLCCWLQKKKKYGDAKRVSCTLI